MMKQSGISKPIVAMIVTYAMALPSASSDFMCVFSDEQGEITKMVTSSEVALTC